MIRKLLCYFGFHHHIELIDEPLTQQWNEWCLALGVTPTLLTYAKCKHCGHQYDSRSDDNYEEVK